jgi:hypothetical protein
MFIESLESRRLMSRPIWGNLGDYLHDWMQGVGAGDFPSPKTPSPYWQGGSTTHVPATQPTTQPTTEPVKA